MIYYSAVLAAILVWTVINSLSLPRLSDRRQRRGESPHVTILVPLRDEERNVDGLLQSLKQLTYNNLSFVFLNDGSSDATDEKLQHHAKNDHRMKIIQGASLPEGWVGKVHACHQLSKHADGEFFLFLDADVRVRSNLVEQTLGQFNTDTGLITGFPHIPLRSFLGHLLVPIQHFLVYVHLPILIANHTTWPQATAAHGAFMMFRAEAYLDMGGHSSVKNSLVEDIHIARSMKKAGWKVKLVNNTRSVSCYMYETSSEVWHGFAKNFFPGLGRSIFLAAFTAFSYALLFILPLPLAVYGLIYTEWRYMIPLLLIFAIKFTVDLFSHQKWWLFLVFPLSVAAMLCILAYSVMLGSTKKGFTWKGRTYQ